MDYRSIFICFYLFVLIMIPFLPFSSSAAIRPTLQCDMKLDVLMHDATNEYLRLYPKRNISGTEVSILWNQYYDGILGRVLECGKEPSKSWYNQHCVPYYLYTKTNLLPKQAFSSPATLRNTLNELFGSIPREDCGSTTTDYCDRLTHVCYHNVNGQRVCVSINSICKSNSEAYGCQTAALLSQLKQQLFRLLDEWEEMLKLCNSSAPINIIESEKPRSRKPIGKSEKPDMDSTVKPTGMSSDNLTLVISVLGATVVLMAVLVFAIWLFTMYCFHVIVRAFLGQHNPRRTEQSFCCFPSKNKVKDPTQTPLLNSSGDDHSNILLSPNNQSTQDTHVDEQPRDGASALSMTNVGNDAYIAEREPSELSLDEVGGRSQEDRDQFDNGRRTRSDAFSSTRPIRYAVSTADFSITEKPLGRGPREQILNSTHHPPRHRLASF